MTQILTKGLGEPRARRPPKSVSFGVGAFAFTAVSAFGRGGPGTPLFLLARCLAIGKPPQRIIFEVYDISLTT